MKISMKKSLRPVRHQTDILHNILLCIFTALKYSLHTTVIFQKTESLFFHNILPVRFRGVRITGVKLFKLPADFLSQFIVIL